MGRRSPHRPLPSPQCEAGVAPRSPGPPKPACSSSSSPPLSVAAPSLNILLVRQHRDARQLLALHVLERSSTAGRDKAHLVLEPELPHRRDRVTAADDAYS